MLYTEAYILEMRRGYLAGAIEEYRRLQETPDKTIWLTGSFDVAADRQALQTCRQFAGAHQETIVQYLDFLCQDEQERGTNLDNQDSVFSYWLYINAFHELGRDLYNSQNYAYAGFVERYGVDGPRGIIASKLDYQANQLPCQDVVVTNNHTELTFA